MTPGPRDDSPRERTPSKTLVLVGTPPGSNDVGGILLEQMLSAAPPDSMVCAALVNSAGKQMDDPRHSGATCFDAPLETAFRPCSGRVGSLVAYGHRRLTMTPWLKRTEKQLVDFARSRGVNRLWAILETTAVIELADRLQYRLVLPLHVQVWDDVVYLCQQRRLDRVSRERVVKSFRRLLGAADRVAVVCEAMADEYHRRYGANCCVVRAGMGDPRPAQHGQASPDEFRIGISGSMYCPSAWNSFLDALDQCGWTLCGKPVRIRLLSADVRLARRSAARIEFLGWRSQEEVSSLLAGCDLLYLPQPFEPHLADLARLSFPTKLSTYVAAGRPVFVHAPEYGSVPAFLARHPIGAVCSSTKPDAIVSALRTLVESPLRYAAAAGQSAAAARGILSREMFLRQLAEFLPFADDGHHALGKRPERGPSRAALAR